MTVNRIITDSGSDLTPEMRSEMGIISVPLTMSVGKDDFRDDETLDRGRFLETIKSFKGKSSSSAPSFHQFQQAIESTVDAFVLTLSSKLSASYDNAMLANQKALENGKGALCVFDSKTASAGQTLIAVKLYELIKEGLSKEQIIKTIHQFIDSMRTYLVLENYETLQRNGRLGKVTGTFIHKLNIKLILGSDGNGEITLYEKCRGLKKTIQQLLSLIDKDERDISSENLVISHCNNQALAMQLCALIKERFDFKKIIVAPTGGLSSFYANDQGIVLAF